MNRSETYSIIRFFQREGVRRRVLHKGVSLATAQEHCNDPQSSWKTARGKSAYTKRVGPWFDGYEKE